MNKYIGLVGLGAVGAPISHLLYKSYKNDFIIISDEQHKRKLSEVKIINGDDFKPPIISEANKINRNLDILIICVKNYDLIDTLAYVDRFIAPHTIVIPLQNGIWACRYIRERYKKNIVAECYVQGPDTIREKDGFRYTRSGVIHIGTSIIEESKKIFEVYKCLRQGGLDIHYEKEIKQMVWKKWMLNAAGNTVTALTGASYKMFKDSEDLQEICRNIMEEFLLVAQSEKINLTYKDINEVIEYYTSFKTDKITSMLEDVIHEKKTENEYITGELLRMASTKGIDLPINRVVYTLVKVKELVYTTKRT